MAFASAAKSLARARAALRRGPTTFAWVQHGSAMRPGWTVARGLAAAAGKPAPKKKSSGESHPPVRRTHMKHLRYMEDRENGGYYGLYGQRQQRVERYGQPQPIARPKLTAQQALANVLAGARGEQVPFGAPGRLGKKRNFDEAVDIHLKLGLDPRKPNQQVRATAVLPHGTGKRVRIAVFAQGEKAEEAKAAGAEIVGGEDLVEAIQGGDINFDRCIASPEMMPLVGRVARILGPRGLMPNPKMGTLTPDVGEAVSGLLKGQVQFKTDQRGNIKCAIGKVSFPQEQLEENLRAFVVAVAEAKPSGAKGKFFQRAAVSSTMGESQQIVMKLLDPASQDFFRDEI